MALDQTGFDVRCEWGERGVTELLSDSDVFIIVDIMSFSTCVEVAVGRGAVVYPYGRRDASAREFADSLEAKLASKRGKGRYSLSPASLAEIPTGTRLVLPSPNGSALSLATGATPTLCGCLRNCRAVARAAMQMGGRIAVIAAGERWQVDDSMRPAVEDLIGAGAIISHLHGSMSPEAYAALCAYKGCESDVRGLLEHCVSGRELVAMGFSGDIDVIAEVDVAGTVPILSHGAFVQIEDQRVRRTGRAPRTRARKSE